MGMAKTASKIRERFQGRYYWKKQECYAHPPYNWF